MYFYAIEQNNHNMPRQPNASSFTPQFNAENTTGKLQVRNPITDEYKLITSDDELAEVAFSGDYSDLSNIPDAIATQAQIQAGSVIRSFGDSYTEGRDASPLTARYTSFFNSKLGTIEQNFGHTGDGFFQCLRLAYQNATAFNNKIPTTVMIGYNDVTYIGNDPAGPAKMASGYRAFLTNHFLKTIVASSDASITRTGTWTNLNNGATKSKQSFNKDSVYSTVQNSTLTWTSPVSTNIVVGLLGCDTATNDGTITITVDGGTPYTYDPKGRTKLVSGHDNDSARINDAYILGNLQNTTHTVVVNVVSNTLNAFVDFFGTLQAPNAAPPIFVGDIVYRNAAGYAYQSPPFKDAATVDAYNAAIHASCDEFKALGYGVYNADTNEFFDPDTELGPDDIHPLNPGHTHIGMAFTKLASAVQDTLTINAAYKNANIGYETPPTTSGLYIADSLTRVNLLKHGDDALGNTLRFDKQRGTLTAPTALLNNDNIALLRFYGYDGANLVERASIRAVVAPTGTISSGNLPSQLVLYTGISAATPRMLIDETGKTVISTGGGTLATPVSTLELRGTNSNLGGLTIFSTLPRLAIFGNGSGSATLQLLQASAVLNFISSAGTNLMQLNDTGLAVGGATGATAGLHLPGSTTAKASLRLPRGSAFPTAPNQDEIVNMVGQTYIYDGTKWLRLAMFNNVSATNGQMLFAQSSTNEFIASLPKVANGVTYAADFGGGGGTWGLGTLTGVTISGATNTLSNIPFSALTATPTTVNGYGITGGTLTAALFFNNTTSTTPSIDHDPNNGDRHQIFATGTTEVNSLMHFRWLNDLTEPQGWLFENYDPNTSTNNPILIFDINQFKYKGVDVLTKTVADAAYITTNTVQTITERKAITTNDAVNTGLTLTNSAVNGVALNVAGGQSIFNGATQYNSGAGVNGQFALGGSGAFIIRQSKAVQLNNATDNAYIALTWGNNTASNNTAYNFRPNISGDVALTSDIPTARTSALITANLNLALNADYLATQATAYTATLPTCGAFTADGSKIITILVTGTGGVNISVPNGYAMQSGTSFATTTGTGGATLTQGQKVQLIPIGANSYYLQPLNGSVTLY